jgi:hypothetical protein
MFWNKKSKQAKAEVTHRSAVLSALKDDAENAGIFADFVVEALNRGYAMKIIVEVDGVTCKSGLIFAGGEFAEYMANWACAQKITKWIKATKFEEGEGGNAIGQTEPRQKGKGGWSEQRNTPYSDYG